jgi:rhodanese-related sulfurtransferase
MNQSNHNINSTKFKSSSHPLRQSPSFDAIINALNGKKVGNSWKCFCPAHNDGATPGLSVTKKDGKILFHCFSGGCSQEAVVEALTNRGLWIEQRGEQKITEYIYKNDNGEAALKVVRTDLANGKKQFHQKKMEHNSWQFGGYKGELRPYRHDEWEDQKERRIFHVEGEKCADKLVENGFLATTTAGGSNGWKPHYSQYYKDRNVTILPDNDSPGRAYSVAAYNGLLSSAKSVTLLELPYLEEGEDIADFFMNGRSAEDLKSLVANPPPMSEALKELLAKPEQQEQSTPDKVEPMWAKPVPLDEYNLGKHPIEMYPEVIRKMVLEVSRFTETPVEMAALLSLATVSAAVSGKFEVQVKPGYIEPTNLYVATLLESGNRKTAVLDALMSALKKWEIQKAEAMALEIANAKSKRQSEEAVISGLRSQLKKGEGEAPGPIISQIAKLESELTKVPASPELFSSDVTPEKLAELMGQNNERFALISDEGGVFGPFLGLYNGGKPNLDLLLKSHAVSSAKVHRKNGPTIHLKHPTLTIAVAPQPDIFRSLSKVDGVEGRGLLARFLYAVPASKVGFRTNDMGPIDVVVQSKFDELIHTLLDSAPNPIGTIELSDEAREKWMDFAKEIEPGLREGERFTSIKAWASKLPGATVRIAGLLHLIEDSSGLNLSLSGATMEAAIKIAKSLVPHAFAAFSEMKIDPQVDDATKVFRWIRGSQLTEFSQRDCHKRFQHRFPKVDRLESALKILLERNIIREQTSKARLGRPTRIFEVNPANRTEDDEFCTYCTQFSEVNEEREVS